MDRLDDAMAARPNCTASTVRNSQSRGWLLPAPWLAVALVVASLLGAVPIARADSELGHSGETGRHRLADLHDSPGAVCDIVLPGLDSLGETWLRVNPPIMFARNRTDDVDTQYVGWRATVSTLNESTDEWRAVRRAEIARDLASDDLASYFDGEGWLAAFPLARGTYAVTVEMLWYHPDHPEQIEGRAVHAIEHFMIILRYNGEVSHGRTASVCQPPR